MLTYFLFLNQEFHKLIKIVSYTINYTLDLHTVFFINKL
jgi:hypothetical protein